ncbi:MAG: hypothetical protein HC902_02950 [Calothrix sp. SM1_5_4]|nr:hypothetical protein [Calothrix sp. SM1_5_4]
MRDRIAPADFEFQSNMLSNGKDSDVGSYFLTFTTLDFKTPPLSAADQERLKPITVIVGEADGVVYVGREKEFAQAYGGLTGKNEYIVMGPGNTWKSKSADDWQPTGHNIYDYLVEGTWNKSGSGVPFVYTKIGDLLLSIGQPAKAPSVSPQRREVLETFSQTLVHAANFLGQREMVKGLVEYVDVRTPRLPELSARKVELDEYHRRIETRRREGEKDVQSRVDAALEALRAELGLGREMTLKRAEDEYNMPPLSEERRRELESFIGDVRQVEENLVRSFDDREFEQGIAELREQYAEMLKAVGLERFEDSGAKLEELKGLGKNVTPEQERLRKAFGQFHQKYSALLKDKLRRFGIEKDSRLAALRYPEGITDYRMADRELRADRSPERRAKLASYIQRYPAVQEESRARATEELNQNLEVLPKPGGVDSVEHGRRLKEYFDAVMGLAFSNDDPELTRLVEDMTTAANEREGLARAGSDGHHMSLEQMEHAVDSLRVKRSGLLRKWEGIWRQGALTSDKLAAETSAYDSTLDAYKRLFHFYQQKEEWLWELKDQGRFDDGCGLAGNPRLALFAREVPTSPKGVSANA